MIQGLYKLFGWKTLLFYLYYSVIILFFFFLFPKNKVNESNVQQQNDLIKQLAILRKQLQSQEKKINSELQMNKVGCFITGGGQYKLGLSLRGRR